MEGRPEQRVRVVGADTVMPLWKGEHGSEARLMLTTSGPAATEVCRWTLEPGEEYPSHPHQAGVTETISVTRGEMVLVVDGVDHTVAAGQTATFDADATHTYRGTGARTCHLIMTVHLPRGPGSVPMAPGGPGQHPAARQAPPPRCCRPAPATPPSAPWSAHARPGVDSLARHVTARDPAARRRT